MIYFPGCDGSAFASENATVVVGTVIDMEMDEELRVTVVATGIGGEKRADISLVSSGAQAPAQNQGYASSRSSAAVAHQAQPVAEPEQKALLETEEKKEEVESYFDIPAFLRKQAD